MDILKIDTISALLKRAVWDYDMPSERLLAIFEGRAATFSMTANKLKARLLMSTAWYTLVDVFGVQKLKEFLSDDVLEGIHIQDVRQKFRNARAILYACQ